MDEIKEEVIAEAPPAEEVQEAAQEEVVETSETPEVKPEVKDDRPIENVAWEVKRKLDETIPTLQNEIRELKTFITERQQPQENKPSKAQLLAYASDPNTTVEQRIYAYTEVDKLDKEERRREYESLATSTQKRTESENRRSQSAGWVAQTFPDTVVKDQLGNPLGWNTNSSLYLKANEYMNRSENLRNDPEGFAAAIKMAAFDLGISPSQVQKNNRVVAQLRKEQKKQLASAGGTRITETPETTKNSKYEALKKRYSETGDSAIFAEMVKMRGLNPFV